MKKRPIYLELIIYSIGGLFALIFGGAEGGIFALLFYILTELLIIRKGL